MTQERPLGQLVQNWVEPPRPNAPAMDGYYTRLERLNPDRHAADLFAANSQDRAGMIWDYLPYGPFESLARYHRWMKSDALGEDPMFYAVFNKEIGRWCGVASYLRIKPDAGSIEVGHINFAPSLQKSRAATEAIYLMMAWAFENGYRRFEWKCNALNMASRRAAERYGLSFEGVFRQATISKGRNRDTAWFAAIDTEWLQLKSAFELWLKPENFTASGQQIERLWDLTRPVRVGSDPLRG